MSERRKALAAIIVCVLFWGFSFISIKITVAVFPPMSLGALRFALALVFLFFIKRALAPNEKLKLRDIPLLAGAGLAGVTLYFFCENNGVSLVTASEASIVIGVIPVLTMITDWLGSRFINSLRKRKGETASDPVQIRLIQWLGAIISVAGVWLVAGVSFSASLSNQPGENRSPLGYVYMAGAAVCWVAYCFLTRPLFARCPRIYIVFWQSVAGFIGFLPFALFEFKNWGAPNIPVLLHLAFLGIGCSALGYWFYTHSLKALGVSVTSTFINLIPIVTVIAGFFMLGDRLSPLQWVGGILALGGVYLTMKQRKERKSD